MRIIDTAVKWAGWSSGRLAAYYRADGEADIHIRWPMEYRHPKTRRAPPIAPIFYSILNIAPQTLLTASVAQAGKTAQNEYVPNERYSAHKRLRRIKFGASEGIPMSRGAPLTCRGFGAAFRGVFFAFFGHVIGGFVCYCYCPCVWRCCRPYRGCGGFVLLFLPCVWCGVFKRLFRCVSF